MNLNSNSDSDDDDFKLKQHNTNTDYIQRRMNQLPPRSHSHQRQREELLGKQEDQQPYDLGNITAQPPASKNFKGRLAKKSLENYQKKKGAPIAARHDINTDQASAMMNKSREFDEGSNDLNIEYSHQSLDKLEQLDKSMSILHKQMNLSAYMKGVDKAAIELDSQNKFVGYRSGTLTVALTETKGWLRKLVQEVKMLQSTIYPMRYYKQCRTTGQFLIYSKPDGKVKHEFSVKEILSVRRQDEVQTKAINGPTDFPWLFLLQTKERTYYLYANTEEERDIWVHELANFCSLELDAFQKAQLKPHVRDRIDPFLQMEIKNLSQNIMQKFENEEQIKNLSQNMMQKFENEERRQEERNMSALLPDPNMSVVEVQEYFSDQKLSMFNDQEMESQPKLVDQSAIETAQADGTIGVQNNDFIQYWTNGQINYVSKTLIANDFVIEGYINLDEIDTAGLQLPQQPQNSEAKYVTIDFNHKKITVQQTKSSEDQVKLIPFTSIQAVSFNEDNSGEEEELGNMPSYKMKFQVQATDKEYNFFARTKIERQLWVDYFQRVVNQMITPKLAEEEFYKSRFQQLSSSRQQSQLLSKSQSKASITEIKKEDGYVEYSKGGIQHYVSDTLQTKETIVEGLLMKKTRSTMGKILKEKQIVSRMVMINYRSKTVSFRNVQTTDSAPVYPKFLDFKDIMSVEKTNIDIWAGELELKSLKFKEKFIVYAKNRSYPFFARTDKERELWIEAFCRAIDINNGVATNLHHASESYTRLAARSVTRYNSNQRPTKMIGGDNYESIAMKINYDTFRGYLMKRIDKREWYHTSNFHKRHFDVNFDRSIIVVKKLATDDTIHKRISLNTIRSCTIKVEVESDQSPNKEFKRSKSWLSKMRKSEDESCKWNFSFELDMSDRTMELYAPNRLDREKWVNMFQLISEMNERLISTKDMKPLDFQKFKQEEERKKEEAFQLKLLQQTKEIKLVQESATNNSEQEETKVTEPIARNPRGSKLDLRIKDPVQRVETWLVKNQHLMSKNTVKTINCYESNYMSLNIDRVQGQVYIINPSETAELDPQTSYERQNQHEKLTKSNLLVDLAYCSMIFENTEYNRENVEYENFIFGEVQSVERSDYQIGEEDLRALLPVDFKDHCFKITFTQRNTKLIACGSLNDRVQWLRTFNIIAQVNRLKIEQKTVNLFIFEQSQLQQFQEAQEQQEKMQSMSFHAMKQYSEPSDDEDQESIDIEQLYEKKAMRKLVDYYSPTFTMTFRFIEGFMIKDIENRKLYHKEQFHLRFFRIVFNTGKLVIKQDRRDKKMRTFNLDQLQAVDFQKRLITWHIPETCNTQMKQVILSKDDIESKYNIEESSKINIWQYSFTLQFTGRRFDLACRTIQELENWLRVFNLVIKMRQESKSLEQVNPFVFEQQCAKIPNQAQAYKEELVKQGAQNMTTTEPEYGVKDNVVGSSDTKNVLTLEKYFDTNYKASYYFNTKTKESIWTLPIGVKVNIIDMTKKQTGEEVQEEQEESCTLKTTQTQQSSVNQGRKGFKSKVLSDETRISGYDWREFKAIAMKPDFKTTQTYTGMTEESKHLVNALIQAQAKQANSHELLNTQYSARDHYQSSSPQQTISKADSPSASQKSTKAVQMIMHVELLNNMRILKNQAESGYDPVLKLRQQQQSELIKQDHDHNEKCFTEEIKNDIIESEDEHQRNNAYETHQPIIRTRTPMQLYTKGASVLDQMRLGGSHEEPSESPQVTVQNITLQGTSQHQPAPQPLGLLSNHRKLVVRDFNPVTIPPLPRRPIKPDSYRTVATHNVYSELESPSVLDDQSYGHIGIAQKKKKKKKKKRRVRDMSLDNRQQGVNSELGMVRTLATFEPEAALPSNRAQSVEQQMIEDVKENSGSDQIMNRCGAVESIIDGGFIGFSDSDDDDARQLQQDPSQHFAPRRLSSPKPKVIKTEEVFEDVPQATQQKKTIHKDIIVVRSAAVTRIKHQPLDEPTIQHHSRHSEFLQKFSGTDKQKSYIDGKTEDNSMWQHIDKFAKNSHSTFVDNDVISPKNAFHHRKNSRGIRKKAIASAMESSCLTDNSHRSALAQQEEREEAKNDCEIEEFVLDF